MIVHPDWRSPAPVVLWMHGRTVSKEIDPGRALRLLRAGIGFCALDLPGHGERLDPALHEPDRAWDVVTRMIDEIDPVTTALLAAGPFDPERVGVGGVSAGGMAVLARLCRPHRFACAGVEATTGSWGHQRHRAMFAGRPDAAIGALDPIRHLDGWRPIPFLAIHSRLDEWVSVTGQAMFVEALRRHYDDPTLVEFVQYDRTGAPFEHAGFGAMSGDAKNRQRDFFARRLG
jgi:poly(3-hydroxybutyrate) depolymerase